MIVAVGTFFGVTLIGHVVHWAMHQRWSGPMFRAHLVHHAKYSLHSMESETYRSPGKADGLFTFVPICAFILLCTWALFRAFHFNPWIFALVFVEGTALGVLHESVHNATHLKNHWFHSIGAQYWHLRKLHRIHHRHVRKNYGIIWHGWDKLFGSYRDIYPDPSQSKRASGK